MQEQLQTWVIPWRKAAIWQSESVSTPAIGVGWQMGARQTELLNDTTVGVSLINILDMTTPEVQDVVKNSD